MKSEDKIIGSWLKDKRIEAGMTQEEVGKKLNKTKTAIHYYESGKRTIYATTLMDYCHAIGADANELVKLYSKIAKA